MYLAITRDEFWKYCLALEIQTLEELALKLADPEFTKSDAFKVLSNSFKENMMISQEDTPKYEVKSKPVNYFKPFLRSAIEELNQQELA